MIKLLLCYIAVMTDLKMLRMTTSYDDDDDKSWQLFTGLLLGLLCRPQTSPCLIVRALGKSGSGNHHDNHHDHCHLKIKIILMLT